MPVNIRKVQYHRLYMKSRFHNILQNIYYIYHLELLKIIFGAFLKNECPLETSFEHWNTSNPLRLLMTVSALSWDQTKTFTRSCVESFVTGRSHYLSQGQGGQVSTKQEKTSPPPPLSMETKYVLIIQRNLYEKSQVMQYQSELQIEKAEILEILNYIQAWGVQKS